MPLASFVKPQFRDLLIHVNWKTRDLYASSRGDSIPHQVPDEKSHMPSQNMTHAKYLMGKFYLTAQSNPQSALLPNHRWHGIGEVRSQITAFISIISKAITGRDRLAVGYDLQPDSVTKL